MEEYSVASVVSDGDECGECNRNTGVAGDGQVCVEGVTA